MTLIIFPYMQNVSYAQGEKKLKHILFGANGFIGSHVAEVLATEATSSIACVRRGANTEFLQQLGIKIHTIDNFDHETLCQLMNKDDVIYNCIADVHLHKSLQQYNRTQVGLTETLAKAATAAGVKRFVQLSTVKVYGDTPAHFITEEQTFKPLFDFHQTMIDRESVLLKIANSTGLDLVILRPAGTLGRRSPVLKYFLNAHKKGSFPIIGSGQTKFSAVDTRDIGRAMFFLGNAALDSEKIFLLKGYETSWLDLKTELDQIRGINSKTKSLPVWFAKLLGAIWEKLTPYGKSPFLTRFAAHDATQCLLVDDNRIRKLGFNSKYQLSDTMRYIVQEASEEQVVVT